MLPENWHSLTLESAASKQIDEFIKKYKGTYVWIDRRILMLFEQFDENYFHFIDDDGTRSQLVFDSDHTLDVWFPQVGLFTHKEQLAYFSRIPARQYRKGPCRDNCLIVYPLQTVGLGGSYPITLNSNVLKSAYSPLFFDYYMALDYIEYDPNFHGAALSRRFGMMLSPKKEFPAVLTLFDQPIGFCDKENIILKVPELEQEVRDFVRDFGLGVKVDTNV